MMRDVQQVIEEDAALVGKQRLGRTHARRSAARKDYGREHDESDPN